MPALRPRRERLTAGLVLLGFLLALVSGALHPLGLVDQDAVRVCHDHTEGHLDPAAPADDHDHTCVYCRLAHSLSHTDAAAPAPVCLPDMAAGVPAPSRASTRPATPVRRGCPPRAPPCV